MTTLFDLWRRLVTDDSAAIARHAETMTALRTIMTDVQNLTAAVGALQTAVTGAVAAIEQELATIASANTGNDPQIAAAVETIKGLTASLTAETAKVTPAST